MSTTTLEHPHTDPSTAAGRRPGIDLFRIAGIRIRLHYSWFLIFLLLLWSLSAGYLPTEYPGESTGVYWGAGLIAVVLFFGSLLLHELAHSLVAKAHGMEIPEITLFLFGGVSELREEPDTPGWEFKIAVVGPLMSFALGALFWGIHAALPASTTPIVMGVIAYVGWINLALGVFNLLPGFPLDGGRLLRALLWQRGGSLRRATRQAADVGKALAIGIMVLGGIEVFLGGLLGGVWLLLIGMFLRSSAEAGYQGLVMRSALEHCDVASVMTREPVTVSSETTLQTLIDAYILARGHRGFPVVDGDRAVGLITLGDVQDVPRDSWSQITVADRMHPSDDSIVVAEHTPLTDALEKMQRNGKGRLLVMKDGKLAGMLSKEALLRFVTVRNLLDLGDEPGAPVSRPGS